MARFMYGIRDYFNMLRLYFENFQQENRAAAAYREEYQGRGNADRNVIIDLIDRLLQHGQMMPIYGGGRPRSVRTVENEEAILAYFEAAGDASARDAERDLGISKSTIYRVLKDEGMHPYHYRGVQCLHENDPALRLDFCNYFNQRTEAHESFPRRILWTDESSFTRDGMYNTHNYHYWSHENPHLVWERSFQDR